MGIKERAWLAGGIFAAFVAVSAGDGGRAAADETGMVVAAYRADGPTRTPALPPSASCS